MRYPNRPTHVTKRLEAADRLELLSVVARRVARDLRGEPTADGQDDADVTAYGRVFWLRRQLGYVVGSLGVNPPASWVTRLAEREYGPLLASEGSDES